MYLKRLNISGTNIFLVLTLCSIIISYGIAKLGIIFGAPVIILLVGIPVTLFVILVPRFGFLLASGLSFFIAYINRWTFTMVPLAVVDIILYLTTIGILIKIGSGQGLKNFVTKYFKNPITYALLVWVIYNHFQLLNLNSTDILSKLLVIRQSWYSLLAYVIGVYVFENINSVKAFIKIILALSLLAAIFGLTQKHIGLLPFEREWLYSSPLRIRLYMVWGQVRAWSFLNDPTSFGLLMSTSAVTCIILMTGSFKFYKKVLLAICVIIMLLAMVASGTRTAFVIFLVGVGFFGLINIRSTRTQIACILVSLVCVIIYFGPFYSAPIQRIRSAFQGDKDPSMNVRLINKEKIRPYLLTHPIGGGSNATQGNNTSHILYGFPPDSGYLKIALELGYVGLLIILWLYYRASAFATQQYFNSQSREKKIVYLIILTSLLALFTAEVTQITISQKPFDLIVFAYFALLTRLKDIKQL